MAKKEFIIEDSPAMRFVTDSPELKNFAAVQRKRNEERKEGVREGSSEIGSENSNEENPETTIETLAPVLSPVAAPVSDDQKNSDPTIRFVIPEPPELLTKTLSVKVTQAVYDEVKRRANERGISISKYAGEAIKMVINKIDV